MARVGQLKSSILLIKLFSLQAKLVVPARSWFKPVPGGSETLADGFFLKRLGVTESDVLNGRYYYIVLLDLLDL